MSNECKKIKDLFDKDIYRNLNGVIKVDQEKDIITELEEYVITKETRKNLDRFFGNYLKTIENPSDKVGVWVSGFFGSGKSHFIKMLSYLLENKKVGEQFGLDYFREKIDDPSLMSMIEKVVATGEKEVVLFNIDTKTNKSNTGDRKELIVRVMMRALNEKRGYSSEYLWLAEIEEDLEIKGLYEHFKEVFLEKNGESWEKKRDGYWSVQDDIIDALVSVDYLSKEACNRIFENEGSGYVFTIERFAKKINEYCDRKGSDFQVVFLVDEVGQYIGDNSDLMLDLQSIVEELGVVLQGKAWVIVTSQADVDSIIKDQIKGVDFSKIQGRFDTRLPLSSSNVDEVIKKRVLKKKRPCEDMLASFFAEKKTIVRNLICFEKSAEMKSYDSEDVFIDYYPFIPYQVKLLQKVFDEIRYTGYSGKHLAKGERSMLSAFKESAERHGEEDVGYLVPFSSFYDTVESFIDPIYKKTIDQAYDNTLLHIPEDVELLKILFMIRPVKEIKATLDNLVVLRISNVDEDKKALKERIASSLSRLEEQVLIHKTQDEYYFLTNREQEINKQINHIDIDPHHIQEEIFNFIFNDIYSSTRYDVYQLNRVVDSREKQLPNADLTIKFLTPASHEYNWSERQQSLQGENLGLISSEDTLLFLFPEKSDFMENIRKYLQISQYINQYSSGTDDPIVKNIYLAKSQERADLQRTALASLNKDISNSKVFICGKEVSLDRSNPKERIKEGLDILAQNVFSKKDYVKQDYETYDDVLRILRSDDLEKYGIKNETNKIARDEIIDFIKLNSRRHVKVCLSDIKAHFLHKPYGWKDMTISGLVALLYISEDVKLRYQKTYLISQSPEDIAKYLTKSVDADKLVVEIREKASAEKILTIKQIMSNVFDKIDMPEKETDLYRFIKDTIQSEHTSIESIMAKYDEEPRYPGKKYIDAYEKILKQAMDYTDPTSLFEFLITQEEQIKQISSDVEPVKNFFESRQVEIYRRVLHNLEKFKRNTQFLTDDIVEEVKKIEEIIDLEDPYSRITELSPIEGKIEHAIDEVLKQKKKDVKSKLDSAIEEIKSELSKYPDFDTEFKDDIIQPFVHIDKMISKANECALVVVQLNAINELKQKSYQKIEEQKQNEKEPGSSDVKEIAYLNNTDVFRYSKIIENDEDLEAYINEIKSKLKDLLKDKKIKII